MQAAQTTTRDEEHEAVTLSEILAYLNPPNQDYASLASRAKLSIASYQQRGPRYHVEAGMASYFFLFGRGYLYWQQNYLYNTIHEYFYSAYVRATSMSKEIAQNQALNGLLYYFSRMMIHYSRCENSVISNNPSAWEFHSAKALSFANAVLAILDGRRNELLAAFQEDASGILATIRQYVATNSTLYKSINLSARVYLGAKVESTEINAALEQVKTLPSAELASEMNAHLTFARRYLGLKQHSPADIIIRRANVTLRGIGSIPEIEHIKRIFDLFDDPEYGYKKMKEEVQKIGGLPAQTVDLSAMQDIFETALGVDNLKELEFDLTPNRDEDDTSPNGISPSLTFTLNDGNVTLPYVADKFVVKISRLGTVSVEITFGVEDISLSHLRQIETLVAPHMGEISITWEGMHPDSHEQKHGTQASSQVMQTNFVEQYLLVQDALNTLRAMPGVWDVYQNWTTSILPAYAQFLAETIDEPTNLSTYREKLEEEEAEDDAPDMTSASKKKKLTPEQLNIQENIVKWEGYYAAMNRHIVEIRSAIVASRNPDAQKVLADLMPSNVKSGYFKDIFQQIFDGLCDYLNHLAKKHGLSPTGIDYDPNIGWQTIVCCTNLALRQADGQTTDIEDIAAIEGLDDFKGLLIQSREARATIEDWHLVKEPAYQNRAIIRSHTSDFMVLSENRAFLFFCDDPQYLVDQYVSTVRIIANLRAIVVAFNEQIKNELTRLNKFQITYENTLKGGKSAELNALNDNLDEHRSQIEALRIRAGQVLELLRSSMLSKYPDHSDLMKALIADSNILAVRDALKENVAELDRFQGYVGTRLQKRIADISESQQRFMNILLLIIGVVSSAAAIEPISQLIIRVARFFGTSLTLADVDIYVIAGLVAIFSGILLWRTRRPR